MRVLKNLQDPSLTSSLVVTPHWFWLPVLFPTGTEAGVHACNPEETSPVPPPGSVGQGWAGVKGDLDPQGGKKEKKHWTNNNKMTATSDFRGSVPVPDPFANECGAL